MPFSNDTPPCGLYRDDEIIEDPTDIAMLTRRYSEAAVAFIDSVAPGKPFFAYVAYHMPHYLVTPEPAFAGKSEAGSYGDVVEAIDFYTGLVHDAIERRGEIDSTIFVFTSDHGPWFEGSTGGARGRKFETWEGGVRIPFIISWPAHIPAGQTLTGPTATATSALTSTAVGLVAVLGLRRVAGSSL